MKREEARELLAPVYGWFTEGFDALDLKQAKTEGVAMPTERLSNRKVGEVLRLKHAVGLSYREISEATGVGRTAVWEYIRHAEVIGITWPVPENEAA